MNQHCPECDALGRNKWTDYGIIRATQDYVARPEEFLANNGAEHIHYRALQTRIVSVCDHNHQIVEFRDLPRCDAPGCIWEEQLFIRENRK